MIDQLKCCRWLPQWWNGRRWRPSFFWWSCTWWWEQQSSDPWSSLTRGRREKYIYSCLSAALREQTSIYPSAYLSLPCAHLIFYDVFWFHSWFRDTNVCRKKQDEPPKRVTEVERSQRCVLLRQGCQTQGPGAKSGPWLHLMWVNPNPNLTRACKEYNTFIIRLYATLQKHVAHKLHVPQCISFCDVRTEETCSYFPWTSAFRRS